MSFVANLSATDLSLESLTRNYSAKSYREETLNGRRYIVSPMTMIVPGVLNGSKGRLFYPEDEVGKDPTPWNGMPITHYHPSVDGKPVSANHERAKDQHIGFIQKATSNQKLKAEAWVDVEKADARDTRIVQSIRAGNPMEISTGLYTDNYPAPAGAQYKGKPYNYIARNYRPDHLAILPDQKGACSLNDGCGLGVNNNPNHDPKNGQFASGTIEVWHGGSGKEGKHVTYHTTDKEMAESYVQMYHDRFGTGASLHRKTITIVKPAPEHVIMKEAKKLGMDNEYNTPASIFDSNLHEDHHVGKLVKTLRSKGYDGAVLEDIPYGEGKAGKQYHAHITFTGGAVASPEAKTTQSSKSSLRKVPADKQDKRQQQLEKALARDKRDRRVHNQEDLTDNDWAEWNRTHGKTKTMGMGGRKPKHDKTTIQQAHAHTKKAVALATKHSQEKSDHHKNASALVRAHLDAAKLHTKHGDSKNASKALDKARKAVTDYSKKRASQHEKVAAAFAKAGDHKMAAHYKARADFHHAHIAKITKKTPATNSEFMPRGEREFVMNQLSKRVEAKKLEMAQTKKPVKNKETQFFLTDNAVSHEELRNKLDKALRSKLTQNDPQPYIHEVHDDHVKYDHGGQMKKCNYKMTDNDEIKMGKPKDLKRVVTYEEAGEPDGDEPEMNQLTEDGIEPSTTTPRKGGNMAKLTANQRTATIDKLTSNEGCGCFNEEDKDYLSGLSDERLQAMADNHAKHTENADPEDDDDDEEEPEEVQNKAKKPKKEPVVNSQPKERMTINEFRETAPVEYLEAVDEAAQVVNEKKTEIVTKLTAHLKKDDPNKARLTANLLKESLPTLRDRLLLIPEPVKQTTPASRVVYGPTGNAGVTDEPVDNEEDDVAQMLSPRIDYLALSKENAAAHRRN